MLTSARLARLVVRRPYDLEAMRAYWTAATARICDEIVATHDADRRFLLGILYERCERSRGDPGHPEARRKLELVRLAHVRGARIANVRKSGKYGVRDEALSVMFEAAAREEQRLTGCDERKAESAARETVRREMKLNIGDAQMMRIIRRKRTEIPDRDWNERRRDGEK